MMPEDFEEKRKYKRFPASTQVAYRELKTESDRITNKYSARTLDVSADGLCMETEFPPKIGQLLEIEIATPTRPEGMRILAMVQWIGRRSPDSNIVRFGVEFFKAFARDTIDIVETAKKGLWIKPA